MTKLEVIYVEGLPASGKTTLISRLCAQYPDRFEAVNEYVDPDDADDAIAEHDETYFLRNDERKYRLAKQAGRQCLVDRGHLSTILYNKAHELITGQKQVDVDTWYFNTILKRRMLPDAYIHLDTEPETSLRRRPPIAEWDNMWDHEEALIFARQGYVDYMGSYEPQVPVLRLSADELSISEIDHTVLAFLSDGNGNVAK